MDYVKELRAVAGTRPLILSGAVALIVNEQNELLLQKRKDGSYGLPGGLMELGESLEETAKREVKEETGLLIEHLQLMGVFSGPEYYFKVSNGDEFYSVTAVFLTREYSGKLTVDETESQAVAFFSLDKLPEGLTEEYKGYIFPFMKELKGNEDLPELVLKT